MGLRWKGREEEEEEGRRRKGGGRREEGVGWRKKGGGRREIKIGGRRERRTEYLKEADVVGGVCAWWAGMREGLGCGRNERNKENKGSEG